MAPAAAAKVAAQLEVDAVALHQARIDAGELKDDAVQKKKVPYDNFYAPYECNPHRNYASDWGGFCFNGDQFRSQTMWAWGWSQQHPAKADRKPVPYPGLGDGGGGKLAMVPHTVYVVKYSSVKKGFIGPVKANKVFKYGITSIPHYQTRANVGRSACNKWAKKKGYRTNECERTWVAVVPATFGWDNARYMEASLIKEYERYYGECPPGQRRSCK